MTIKNCIEHQNNNSVVCFIRQGLFYRAYNQGAMLLNTLLGYRIKHKELLSVGGVVHYVGFPAPSLEQVLERVLAIPSTVLESKSDNLIELSVADCGYDFEATEALVAPQITSQAKQHNTNKFSVDSRLMAFDLSNATPIEAMNLIAELQREIKQRVTDK